MTDCPFERVVTTGGDETPLDVLREHGRDRPHPQPRPTGRLAGSVPAGRTPVTDGGTPNARLPCREFTPASSDAVVVDSELHGIEDATVRNWSDPDVHHFTNPGPASGTCRDPGSITEIVVHETSERLSRDFTQTLADEGYGVHVSVARDGTITAHNDVVDTLYHAGPHNDVSVAVEIPNPVWEPLTGRDDLDVLPVDWPGRKDHQPQGDYVLPSLAQCEGAAAVVELLTDPDHGHGTASGAEGLAVPHEWVRLTDDGRFRMGGPQQTPNDELVPGVWAHGQFGGKGVHVDGYFVALYTLLRLEGRVRGERLDAADAYHTAKTVARSDTSPDMAWEDGVPYARVGQYVGD